MFETLEPAGIEAPIVTTRRSRSRCHVRSERRRHAPSASAARGLRAWLAQDRRRRRDRRGRPRHARLLRERGYDDVRVVRVGAVGRHGDRRWSRVEEATPEALSPQATSTSCLFSVGTSASRELVPHAVRGGAVAVDKSSAYRLQDGVPLVVPEVNGDRALEHDGIVANPNCCTIPLTCVLKPLHEAAGLARVRVATYQSCPGAGASAMERLARRAAGRARPRDGLGLRRRGVRRGVEAPRRDAEDHGAARRCRSARPACACR